MPEISIIVPVYKVEQYLDRCVTSILNQTFKDFELILVDDGSPDQCPQICDEWAAKDERIHVIHKKNGGLSSARNAGLKFATGNYIGFVDSDDWITKDMYEYLYRLLQKEKADIAMCSYARKPEKLDAGIRKESIKRLEKDGIWKFFYRVNGEPSNYSVCSRIYKKEVLDGVWFIEGKINEDVLYTYEVYKRAKKIVLSNLKKYLYFHNSEGITQSKLCRKDFALLDIWDEILKREMESPYLEWARKNRMRAVFTLYTKALVYGCGPDIDKKVLKLWKKELKENYEALKKSNFFDRKRRMILFMICKI